jgi:D-alanyl-D-alanine endopeptidase (penicillin-binding protein 7)
MILKLVIAMTVAFTSTLVNSADILAKSWLIADSNGRVLESENINVVQPIASITKLMTAMVILDAKENLQTPLKKKLRGLTVTRQQLLDLAIVKSDNLAAARLCEIYHRGYSACIVEMNRKAQSLGMQRTWFADSSGLDNKNVGTPEDLVKLLLAAEQYPEIVTASNKSVGEIVKKKKRKFIKWKYKNTNPLVAKYHVIVSKTGYVRASGGCLVMSLYINGQKKLFVVLNSTTTRTRIQDMEQLILSMVSDN